MSKSKIYRVRFEAWSTLKPSPILEDHPSHIRFKQQELQKWFSYIKWRYVMGEGVF
jgi:hypothetical protein